MLLPEPALHASSLVTTFPWTVAQKPLQMGQTEPEPREPLQEAQMDFKDATTVPADPRSANASMWSKCSILSTLVPPSCGSRPVS
jgi:hypothetical protein